MGPDHVDLTLSRHRVTDQAGTLVSMDLRPGERQTPAERVLAVLATLLDGTAADAVGAAVALLHRFGSLAAVLAADEERLRTVPGVGAHAARLLRAAHAACALALEERFAREVIASWTALESWARLNLGALPREQVLGIFLDCKNGLIRHEMLGQGTIDHVPLYPREVARRALELDASAVILLHNHPSGDPTPSPLDIEITRQVADALAVVGVALHDHAIVGRERVASMRSQGLL